MHKITLPFGPQHPALPEAVQLTLHLEGEEIVDMDFQVGYHHRGIEKALELKDWMKNIFLAERICGICNVSHSLCYCQTVESLLNIEVPEQAKWIRTFFNELERIQSHLLWFGMFAWEIGFETLFMLIWRDRELVLDIMEMICGNRIHESITTIGGVRRNISTKQATKSVELLEKIKERIEFYRKTIKEDSLIKARTKGIGKLSKIRAKELSVVGPVARASGIDYDIRKVLPYAGYTDLNFKSITEDRGDCYSRLKLRIRELEESVRLARLCLAYLSHGPIKIRPIFILQRNEGISRVEAPRGELVYYIRADEKKPERVKIRTPTYANLHCLKEILLRQQLADVPVIVNSLDPCIACADRIIIIKDGKKSFVELHHLREHHENVI
jgi:Ni,Fe-hydrogenase III large subunit